MAPLRSESARRSVQGVSDRGLLRRGLLRGRQGPGALRGARRASGPLRRRRPQPARATAATRPSAARASPSRSTARDERGHRAHLPDGPAAPRHPGRRVGPPRGRASSSGSPPSTASSTTSTSASGPPSTTASCPWWLVESSDGLRPRGLRHAASRTGARCLVAGIDLVRDGDGTYRVLEDNLRNPSGISYVLENRVAMTRVLPARLRRPPRAPGRPLRPVAAAARCAGWPRRRPARARPSSCSPRASTTRPTSSTPSWPARWASSSSRAATSSSTTTSSTCAPPRGLERVDVIYRRIDDDFLDPVVFRPDSILGVPGPASSAARAGNVTIANAVGNGVADDKAVYAYVPDLIRYYLGEEPHPRQRRDLPALGRGPARRTCSTGSTSWSSSRWPSPAATACSSARRPPTRSSAGVPRDDRGRPPQLHRPGGRVAVAAPHAGRRPPRGPPHRPAPLRALRRARRGDPRAA